MRGYRMTVRGFSLYYVLDEILMEISVSQPFFIKPLPRDYYIRRFLSVP